MYSIFFTSDSRRHFQSTMSRFKITFTLTNFPPPEYLATITWIIWKKNCCFLKMHNFFRRKFCKDK